jgi:hypothetical protein
VKGVQDSSPAAASIAGRDQRRIRVKSIMLEIPHLGQMACQAKVAPTAKGSDDNYKAGRFSRLFKPALMPEPIRATAPSI